MIGQQLLLGLHAGRAADPRAERADLLEILVGPGAVEGNVGQRQPRVGIFGSAGHAVGVADQQQVARAYGADGDDGGEKNRLARRF